MFKKGDKVVCVRQPNGVDQKLRNGDVHIVKRCPGLAGEEFVDLEAPGMDGWKINRFEILKEEVKQADDILRVKCIQSHRPAGLKAGRVYTVKKEHPTLYLLAEIPGKLFKKARFELVNPAPVAVELPELKVGDELKCVDVDLATHKNPAGYANLPKGKIIVLSPNGGKHDLHQTREYDCFVEENLGYYYPKEAFVLADGRPFKGGAVVAQPKFDKTINRPLVVGDKVVLKEYKDWGGYTVERHPWYKEAFDNKEVLVIDVSVVFPYDNPQHKDIKAYIHVKCKNHGFYTPVHWLEFAEPQATITAAKAPPKKIELGKIDDVISKAKSSSLNDYVFHVVGKDKYDDHFNQPCFASFNRTGGPVDQIAVSIQQVFKKDGAYSLKANEQDDFKLWTKYIYEESPWKDCFINKDFEKVWEQKWYELNCDKGVSQLIGGAVAIRDGYEHKSRLKPFIHFLEEGYSGNTAFLMAFIVAWTKEGWTWGTMSHGHSNMCSTQNAQDILKFFKEGYHLKNALAEKPAKEKMGNYQVSKVIAQGGGYGEDAKGENIKEWAAKILVMKQKGEGWNAQSHATEESVKKLADTIEAYMKGN